MVYERRDAVGFLRHIRRCIFPGGAPVGALHPAGNRIILIFTCRGNGHVGIACATHGTRPRTHARGAEFLHLQHDGGRRRFRAYRDVDRVVAGKPRCLVLAGRRNLKRSRRREVLRCQLLRQRYRFSRFTAIGRAIDLFAAGVHERVGVFERNVKMLKVDGDVGRKGHGFILRAFDDLLE